MKLQQGKRGKRLGAEAVERIRELAKQGLGIRAIAKEVGVSTFTVHQYLVVKPDDPGVAPAGGISQGPTDGHGAKGPSSSGMKTASSLKEAAIVIISPRKFEISSSLLWLAMGVTRQEWGWPELPPGEWLDTFLTLAFKQRGILLGTYVKLEKRGSDGKRDQGETG